MGYELVEHTADTGIRVEASDLSSLFREAGLALVDILGAASRRETVTLDVSVEGIDRVDLLVRWLQEILYLITVKDLRVGSISVEHLTDTGVRARLRGAYEGTGLKQEIKAVTYHGLDIVDKGGSLTATVIFDL
ncbi:MAG TPA: archease [Deltaproteobacteria bacterium]|jgi:SHS2 domain-containing protein|nr:archease [Deltaproteobacteria bacterium]HOI05779.1 archease [Deltaproteobacteria bacterium]